MSAAGGLEPSQVGPQRLRADSPHTAAGPFYFARSGKPQAGSSSCPHYERKIAIALMNQQWGPGSIKRDEAAAKDIVIVNGAGEGPRLARRHDILTKDGLNCDYRAGPPPASPRNVDCTKA